jgi:shikimate kinase
MANAAGEYREPTLLILQVEVSEDAGVAFRPGAFDDAVGLRGGFCVCSS